jgi:hypothetical protein
MTAPTLEDMHKALGEFLSEFGRVEFTMLLLMDYLNEAPLEHLFDVYAPKTFGPKIDCFKTWCALAAVTDNKKPILQAIFNDLDELLPKRNNIIHGETWEGTFKGKPTQPYRVGVIKDNLQYLDEFERAQHGANVFDVQQVKDATMLCKRIRAALDRLRGKKV